MTRVMDTADALVCAVTTSAVERLRNGHEDRGIWALHLLGFAGAALAGCSIAACDADPVRFLRICSFKDRPFSPVAAAHAFSLGYQVYQLVRWCTGCTSYKRQAQHTPSMGDC